MRLYSCTSPSRDAEHDGRIAAHFDQLWQQAPVGIQQGRTLPENFSKSHANLRASSERKASRSRRFERVEKCPKGLKRVVKAWDMLDDAVKHVAKIFSVRQVDSQPRLDVLSVHSALRLISRLQCENWKCHAEQSHSGQAFVACASMQKMKRKNASHTSSMGYAHMGEGDFFGNFVLRLKTRNWCRVQGNSKTTPF